MDINEIKSQVNTVAEELFEKIEPRAKIIVLGCSSSEICGKYIGKGSSEEVGMAVVETLLKIVRSKGLYLAVQGCEHINRSLVIERKAAEEFGFDMVNVVPVINAGGACAVAAYKLAEDPVMIEHVIADAGIDIGDTFIGMHIKHVQIPVRPSIKEIGSAHVTCVKSRAKLIGGERAQYKL